MAIIVPVPVLDKIALVRKGTSIRATSKVALEFQVHLFVLVKIIFVVILFTAAIFRTNIFGFLFSRFHLTPWFIIIITKLAV